MADKSSIEWTDASWTPIRARNTETGKVGWHCVHKSDGCKHCYAERMNLWQGTGLPFKPGLVDGGKVELFLDEDLLLQPLRWKKPRMIFVCSMTDLFADFVRDEWIDRLFAVMALCPQHTFQVLTKRPERARVYLGAPGDERGRRHVAVVEAARSIAGGVLPEHFAPVGADVGHIWMGTSAEDQARYDERLPEILHCRIGHGPLFASLEPLLGPIDLRFNWDHCDLCGGTGILARWPKGKCHVCDGRGKVLINGASDRRGYLRLDWVIVGGESGKQARPMHPDWARSLRDQCRKGGVAFFFKQWGEWADHTALVPKPYAPEERVFTNTGEVVGVGVGRDGIVDPGWQTRGAAWMARVGKKAAGRLLDGAKHDGMPT